MWQNRQIVILSMGFFSLILSMPMNASAEEEAVPIQEVAKDQSGHLSVKGAVEGMNADAKWVGETALLQQQTEASQVEETGRVPVPRPKELEKTE